MEKIKIKKIIKILGNLLVLLSLFFVIQKILKIDYNWKNVLSIKNCSWLFLFIIIQTLLLFFSSISWSYYLLIITKKRVNYKQIIYVFVKSNLYKYIPGNIFQYAGRNEISLMEQISHTKIIKTTVLDILNMILIKIIVSIVCLRNYIMNVLKQFITGVDSHVLIIFSAFIFICFILYTYKTCKTSSPLFISSFVYLLTDCFSAMLFICIFLFLLAVPLHFKDIIIIAGGYTFASLLGFITPGAPGGIGIREALVIFLLSKLISPNTLVAAVVIMRFICIISDILAYVIVEVMRIKGRELL